MNITDKINNSRYTFKKILSDEWDTTVISDYSSLEINKIYNEPNISNPYIKSYLTGFICNIKLQHKIISNYNLHIIYYNFPESSPNVSKQKVTKSITDKIKKLNENDYLNSNDSVMLIINEPVSESIQKYKTVKVTRNPFGFIRSNNNKGIEKNDDNTISIEEFIAQLHKNVEKAGYRIKSLNVKNTTLFPDNNKDFTELIYDPIRNKIKNSDMFKRRILGLTS